MKEEWLFPGAVVPVDVETTAALVVEIKRLIDVVGGMALVQPAQRTWVGLTIDEVESGAGLEKAQNTAALDLGTAFWAGARWAEAKLKEKNT
jgi:hypothetical protein